MDRFEVVVTRTLTQTTSIFLEAKDSIEAKRQAVEIATSGDGSLDWTATDADYEISEVEKEEDGEVA